MHSRHESEIDSAFELIPHGSTLAPRQSLPPARDDIVLTDARDCEHVGRRNAGFEPCHNTLNSWNPIQP